MRTEGFSLNEISEKLGISKASVSVWVRSVPLSAKGKARISDKRKQGIEGAVSYHRERTASNLKEAEGFAEEVWARTTKNRDSARVYSGLIYWCEGEKSKDDSSLVFTNSDPALVRTFLSLLREGYDLDPRKFRVCVHLHSYHDSIKQLRFWSKITNIPLAQFIKPYQKKSGGKNIRLGYEGCASIRYHDVRVARQVQAVARVFLKKQGL